MARSHCAPETVPPSPSGGSWTEVKPTSAPGPQCHRSSPASALSRVKNPKAKARLERLIAEAGLFDFGADDGHDDDHLSGLRERVRYETGHDPRAHVAREDAANERSAKAKASMEAARERRARSVAAEAEKTGALRPKTSRPTPVTDPAHVDWRDPDDDNNTLLHKAVMDGDILRIRNLVESLGASLSVMNADRHTPATLASITHQPQIERYLRDAENQRAPLPSARSA